MSKHYCDTHSCLVLWFTFTGRTVPVCPGCGDIGDSLDENGNPPPSEVSQ